MTNDIPLIHTTRGDVPADSLTFTPIWEFDADPATGILSETRFIEEYRAADGEIVKRSVHAYKPNGARAGIDQGAF